MWRRHGDLLLLDPGDSPLGLRHTAGRDQLRHAVEDVQADLVAELRSEGVSWTRIGAALGVGRTAAEKRIATDFHSYAKTSSNWKRRPRCSGPVILLVTVPMRSPMRKQPRTSLIGSLSDDGRQAERPTGVWSCLWVPETLS